MLTDFHGHYNKKTLSLSLKRQDHYRKDKNLAVPLFLPRKPRPLNNDITSSPAVTVGIRLSYLELKIPLGKETPRGVRIRRRHRLSPLADSLNQADPYFFLINAFVVLYTDNTPFVKRLICEFIVTNLHFKQM